MNLGWWWKLLGTQIHAITVPRKNLIMNWNTICFKPDFRRKTQNCSKTRLQFVKQNIFCCSSIKISSHRLGKPPSYARKFSKKKKIHANKNPTIKKEDGLEPFDATRRVEKSHQIKEGLTKRFILSKPKYGKRYLINTYLLASGVSHWIQQVCWKGGNLQIESVLWEGLICVRKLATHVNHILLIQWVTIIHFISMKMIAIVGKMQSH